MTDEAQAARSGRDVRNYLLFSFAALLCMVPVLLLKGMDLWCVFPLLIGALSLMAHWRAGPVFLLLSLGVLTNNDRVIALRRGVQTASKSQDF